MLAITDTSFSVKRSSHTKRRRHTLLAEKTKINF